MFHLVVEVRFLLLFYHCEIKSIEMIKYRFFFFSAQGKSLHSIQVVWVELQS